MNAWLVLSSLDSRKLNNRNALAAFCLSVAALVLAIVGAVFIIPYRKCEFNIYIYRFIQWNWKRRGIEMYIGV